MRFRACSQCSQHLDVDTVHVGQDVECPTCGAVLRVPVDSLVDESASPEADALDETLDSAPEPPLDRKDAEDRRDIVRTLWEPTIQVGDVPEQTIKSDAGSPSPSRSASRTDAIKVHPRAVAHKGSGGDLPEYEILRLLGEGGMGMVYEARQTSVDRSIAIKMMKRDFAQNDRERDRFLSEAVATADLDHPNIVPIHDLGLDADGSLFYAMKEVRGTSWKESLATKSRDENLDVLMRVADAVAFAHSRGLIHRDLKPENVMLGDFGEVLVMDWGLAAGVTAGAKADPLDPKCAIGGTPRYMAPEMALGDAARIGVCSDVYLLGAILFEIVTGKRPHDGKTVMECLEHAAENAIVDTRVSGELVDIARKAMASEPASRYESVKAFQAAVRRFQQHEESLLLATHAEDALEKGRSSGVYDDFADAVAGFKQARTLWEDNEPARAGLSAARIAYAECAAQKQDLDLAISLLDPDDDTHSSLLQKMKRARQEREARRKRIRALKVTSVASATAAVVVLSFAYLWVDRARDRAETERARAETERARAETERVRAEEALTSLRNTAPTFYALAQEFITEQNFAGALTNIEYAVSLQPREPRYQHQKGNILQTMLKLNAAADAYALTVALDSAHPHAQTNRDVSRRLGRKTAGGAELLPADISALQSLMTEQGRFSEAIALSHLLEDETSGLRAALSARLTEAGLPTHEFEVRVDGTVSLQLSGPDINDLSPLEGLPLNELAVTSSSVVDLRPLKGMPLAVLDLARSPVADLAPLKGTRLRSLELTGTKVRDLTPLKGMPLETLTLPTGAYGMSLINWKNGLTYDLTPLADVPLKVLNLTPERIAAGIGELRRIKTLVSVNRDPAEVFWQRHDAGEFYLGADLRERLERAWPKSSHGLRRGVGHTVGLDLGPRADVRRLTPLRGMPISSLRLGSKNLGDLTGLDGMPLTELWIAGSGVTNLSGLAGTPLTNLVAYACRGLIDLADLKGLPLQTLNLGFNPQLKDFSPLAGLPLTQLVLNQCGEVDLTPLRGMPLVTLNLDGARVGDISALRGMRLSSLVLQGNELADLSPLKGMPLQHLTVSSPGVEDLTPLEGMPLRHLYLSCPAASDLSPLVGMQLTNLHLKVKSGDLSALRGMPLGDLTLSWMPTVADLSVLEGMPLRSLRMSGNQVSDLSPLAGMPLEELVVRSPGVNDLTALAGMPLKLLEIGGTSVTNLSPLAGMPLVNLRLMSAWGSGFKRGSQVPATDLSPLAELPLEQLAFDPRAVEEGLEEVRKVKSLKTINDKPAALFWKRYDAGEFDPKE